VTEDHEQALSLAEIQARAVSGTVAVAVRGMVVRALGFVGSLVLARLLTPHDFGLAAVGFTVMAFGAFLSDGGLGAAFVRRTEAPSHAELGSILGVQLAITTGLLGLVTLVAPVLGDLGWVTAIMVASLPLQSLQSPGAIVLERQLRFGRRVHVEVAEMTAYLAWALITVALGAGVWGLATASLARGVVGAVTMILIAPIPWVRPRWRVSDARGALSFGARVQGVSVINLLRDEGLNVAIAVIGGVSQLGLWNVAYRAMQVPFLLFEALWRVSFPVMSRLVSGKHDPVPAVRRILRTGAVVSGIVLVALVGAGPHLLGALLGREWDPGSAVIPPAALGLMVSAPISVAAAGYLYAVGDTRVLLRGAVAHTLAWFAVALPLLDVIGVAALGWGWLASSAVDAAILNRALLRRTGIRGLALVAPTCYVAATAGACGYLLSGALSSPAGLLPSVVVGAAVSEVVFLALLRFVQPEAIGDVLALVRTAVVQRRMR
jgi:O-antigen/teichoic acid export membrane protein